LSKLGRPSVRRQRIPQAAAALDALAIDGRVACLLWMSSLGLWVGTVYGLLQRYPARPVSLSQSCSTLVLLIHTWVHICRAVCSYLLYAPCNCDIPVHTHIHQYGHLESCWEVCINSYTIWCDETSCLLSCPWRCTRPGLDNCVTRASRSKMSHRSWLEAAAFPLVQQAFPSFRRTRANLDQIR
jgi:hypothetical protein